MAQHLFSGPELTLVKHPNLPARRRFRHPVPVVIHQDPLVLGLSTEVDAELLGLLDGWVEVLDGRVETMVSVIR
jgi:hypothetical protein